jgi:hypothetical protein
LVPTFHIKKKHGSGAGILGLFFGKKRDERDRRGDVIAFWRTMRNYDLVGQYQIQA